MQKIDVGSCTITPRVEDDNLISLGGVEVAGVALRSDEPRFAPWFDTYDRGTLSRLQVDRLEECGDRRVLHLKAVLNNDYPFIERRDSSGDVCIRQEPWDAAPIEADFRIVFEPAAETIDGIEFTGLRYWFEYDCADVPVHRIMDRQTWELGGNLDDVNVVCRNLFDLPRKKVEVGNTFSTVGLGERFAKLLPGNLWARWSLLPAFDMQYGQAGVMLAWFDHVSCIRTVVESIEGEASVRYVDLHYFEKSGSVRTNPKTVLFSPSRLDHTEALNLWTRVHDREQRKALDQFGIDQEPPAAVYFGLNVWHDMHFDTTYEQTIDLASEFGAEYVFIDPVWEHLEAYRQAFRNLKGDRGDLDPILEKLSIGNMCRTLDFEVAEVIGGEAGLKRLCDRAASKGVKLFSWMAAHFDPQTHLMPKKKNSEFGHGMFGIFAAKESRRHPDTGYAGECWTVNLNAPIREKIRDQLLGVCERTGLGGFLWDSFSNLGWWQVDYSDGSMRPQFDRMAELFADLTNAGLYIQPEAVVSFSEHSACGLFGGNVYREDLLGYSYKTSIGLVYAEKPGEQKIDHGERMLKGEEPIDLLFRHLAHKRPNGVPANKVPREQWDAEAVDEIKTLFRVYRERRGLMQRRTVLRDDLGVRWDNDTGPSLLFAFESQPAPAGATDAATGETVTDAKLSPNRVYLVPR